MFSNRFDVVISEMNFKKWKTILFWCIYEQKTFWKATATALLKTSFFDMFTKCNGWWRPTNINQNSSLKKAKSKNMLVIFLDNLALSFSIETNLLSLDPFKLLFSYCSCLSYSLWSKCSFCSQTSHSLKVPS
jgi:hypothetical protein